MPSDGIRARLLVLFVTVIAVGSCATEGLRRPQPDIDARIRFYTKKVSQHPRLHQGYALLAVAYLDKARETLDPAFLAKAGLTLEHSITIQPNFLAFKTMTALSNFTHRFEDALRWGKRAAEASPNDTAVTALLVEAYMGLGRYDDAAKLLPPVGSKPGDFYTVAALGQWLASQLRYDEAVDAFLDAATFARAEGVIDLVVWAEVSAAGALLDWGHPGLARPHLDVAASLSSSNKVVQRELRLHLAEFYEAEGRLEKALALYGVLLEKQDVPDIHHKAFLLARWLDREGQAQRHFKAAEKGFQDAIDAGEVYTLGALARLYAEADVNIEKALGLARHNMEYKRDTKAEATLAYVRSKQRVPRRPPGQPGTRESGARPVIASIQVIRT
ncbi:MAG: tetratricopeptide repeat protein [Nitrospinae bacterium]|nr:tetratricopeptide repeat protein [Nitrospinota bacterium]